MKLPNTFLIFILAIMLLFMGFLVNGKGAVFADSKDEELKKLQTEIGKTQSKIDDLSKKVGSLKGVIGNLKGSLSEVLSTINEVEKELDDLDSSIVEVTSELNSKSTTLAEYTVIRDRTLRNFYKKSPNNYLVALVNSNAALSSSITISSYLKKYIDDSTSFIQDINQEISVNKMNKEKLTEIKKDIEGERVKLIAIKKDTEAKLQAQQAELNSTTTSIGDLNNKLGSLLAKQKQILSEKEGNFYASLGNGVETDDPNASYNYKPNFSPAFAAFSYGAYTHYNGMSQYGARGRAEDGQDYVEILKFYYKTGISEVGGLDSKKICIEGSSSKSMGEYLKGLGEMPPTWHEDALKAQVVAARTYAYRYVKSGKCICTSTYCQYYDAALVNRSDRQRWYKAIKDTENEVLKGDVSAQYSSTTGGYINNVGWDGDWPKGSYELKGGSSWFFKGWYTKDTDIHSAKCGRSSPWLNEKEMSDILNSWLVFTKGSKDDRDNITPTTTSCWGGNPYSIDKMSGIADKLGGKFTSVSSVSVSFSSDGRTSSVKFSTNRGSVSINGEEFKTVFNLRASGYISIKSRLYDVKRK